jgi:DNA-binding NarL/FixJ family response regulator
MTAKTAKAPSTVFIVDDHDVVVQGIQSVLRGHPEFAVAGTATDGATAVDQAGTLKPDILVLDVSMPGMNGVETAYQVRKVSPETRLVIFSMHAEPEFVLSLFRAGIAGYVLKDESLGALVDALEIVRNGGTSYSGTVNRLLHEHMLELELGDGKAAREVQDGIARLSIREKQIFPLLADGMSVKEIADRLCISPKTVESHKYNIFDKLKARSIADLTKLGIRKGLVKA